MALLLGTVGNVRGGGSASGASPLLIVAAPLGVFLCAMIGHAIASARGALIAAFLSGVLWLSLLHLGRDELLIGQFPFHCVSVLGAFALIAWLVFKPTDERVLPPSGSLSRLKATKRALPQRIQGPAERRREPLSDHPPSES